MWDFGHRWITRDITPETAADATTATVGDERPLIPDILRSAGFEQEICPKFLVSLSRRSFPRSVVGAELWRVSSRAQPD